MVNNLILLVLIPTSIAGTAAYFDARTRKIPNKFLLIALGVSVLAVLALNGLPGLRAGVVSSLVAGIFFLPLYLTKAVGAGDLKLASVFAFTLDWSSAVWTSIYGILWAGILGVGYVIAKGHGRTLVNNTIAIVTFAKPEQTQLTKIPFAIAFAAGWITQLAFLVAGGAL